MANLQDRVPDYVIDKGNIVRLILFTATFALLFINFYSPFGVKYWFNVAWWKLLVYSSLVILTGVLVVVISRIFMYKLRLKMRLSYWQYFAWVLAEVFFMALFYTIFEKVYFHDHRLFADILKISIQNTALVLLLPYSAAWLYFSNRDKKQKLESLAQSDLPADTSKSMIPFRDEKDVLRFSVKLDNLMYLEASDNYVNIVYLNKDKISKYMLRNSLKRMEDMLKNTEIVRCHRSFMVNFDKVKVLRKDKEGLLLELDHPSVASIPVSRSYVERVMSTFSKYSRAN